MLIERGANIDAVNNKNISALIGAVRKGEAKFQTNEFRPFFTKTKKFDLNSAKI